MHLGELDKLTVFFVLEDGGLVSVNFVLELDAVLETLIGQLTVQVEDLGDVHLSLFLREVWLRGHFLRALTQSEEMAFEKRDSLGSSATETKRIFVIIVNWEIIGLHSKRQNSIEESEGFSKLVSGKCVDRIVNAR